MHYCYVLLVTLTIIPDLCYGVSCVKRVVSPYVALSELFYSCMSIVKNTQHTPEKNIGDNCKYHLQHITTMHPFRRGEVQMHGMGVHYTI